MCLGISFMLHVDDFLNLYHVRHDKINGEIGVLRVTLVPHLEMRAFQHGRLSLFANCSTWYLRRSDTMSEGLS
jgi:hypothetical protein